MSIDDFLDRGNKYYDKGKFDQAIDFYKRILEIEPENKDALIKIGLSYRQKEEYDTAIQWYDKVLEIDPEDKIAINNIGYALECKANTAEDSELKDSLMDQAIEKYEKSLKIDPAYEIPLVNLTNIFNDREEYDKTIEYFERALKEDPLNVANWIDLGRAYRFKEMYEKSIDAYLTALKLDPDDKIAWNNIGWVYYCKKDYDFAIDAYTRSMKIDWKYDLPFANIIKIYKKMIKEGSSDYIAWKNLAYGFLVGKAYRRALDSVNRSLSIKPDFKEAVKLQENIFVQKRKVDMLQNLEQAIDEALRLFSMTAYSVLLRDIIHYIQHNNPDLVFEREEIKFKILEFIRDKGVPAKLDVNKIIFLQGEGQPKSDISI